MTQIAVAPDKYAVSFQPGIENPPRIYVVCSLREALEHCYGTKAHLVTYVVEGLIEQPRIKKEGLELFLARYGGRITTECFMCDVDNPLHQCWTEEGFLSAREAHQKMEILSTAGLYYTPHGFRIVQPLSKPIDVHEAEDHLVAWLYRLKAAGLEVDWKCIDWTRHFRLPNTTYEPTRRSRCIDLSRMQPIDLPPLPAVPLKAPNLESSKSARNKTAGSKKSEGTHSASVVSSVPDLPEHWMPLARNVAAAMRTVESEWHTPFLALAGAMLSLGVPEELVPQLNGAISALTGADTRTSDRVSGARTTIDRRQRGLPFQGLRTLQQDWPDVAAALRAEMDALRASSPSGAVVDTDGGQPSQPERSLEETIAAMEAAIENAPDGLTLIKAECGLGKSQAALRVAARRAMKPYKDPNAVGTRAPAESKTSISVDKNRLAQQFMSSLGKLGQSSLRVFGPLSLRERDGTPICQFHDIAEPLVSGGLRMQWELCERRNRGSKCPHYDGCPAREGYEGDVESRITLGTHALLNTLDARAGSTGMLIIDEVQDFLESVTLTEDDLTLALQLGLKSFDGRHFCALAPSLWALRAFARMSDDFRAIDACEAVRKFEREVPLEALQQGQRSAGLSYESENDAVRCACKAPFPTGHQGTSPPVLKMAIEFVMMRPSDALEIGRIALVLRTVYRAIAAEYPVTVRLEVVERAEGSIRRLVFTAPRDNLTSALRRDGPVVIIDANAELHAPVLARATGQQPPMHVFTAPDGAPIERTMIRTRKATRKAWFTKGRLDPESTLVPLLKTAIDWALEEPNARALGIISVLPVELVLRYAARAWDSSHEQIWKSMKQPRSLLDAFSKTLAPILERWPGTLLTAHYGATRGLDDMAQVDALITLGDPWGNLNAAKNATGYLSCEYEWERRYADCCRAELEQAHGRLRTVHRTQPGRALHVGAVMPGGPKWASERVSVRELPLRWPLEMSELSSEQFATMVKRLGGERKVAKLLGCGHASVRRYASGERNPPLELTKRLEAQVALATCDAMSEKPETTVC